MMLAARPDVLHRVWDFLGAEYIRTDIDLALQSHALKEQFNNWVFDIRADERGRKIFETVHLYCTLAHPELSGRLQGALELLKLQCVNKDLRTKCLDVLKATRVDLYEFVNASRPIQIPAISPDYGKKLRSCHRHILQQALRLDFVYEEQNECLRRLEFLQNSFRQLMWKKQVRLLTWRALKRHKEAVQKRMYKGEVFSWEECVDWWGAWYEISTLYEWFMQLEREG